MINKSYLNRVRKLSGDEVPSFMKRAVAIVKYQKRVNSLKAKGAIPFTETGFEKISWDMFQKTEEPDFGSIWVVTTIKNANDEDEKWLVVNVDDNDKILRSVKASITKKAIIPGDSAMYEYEPGKFQQVFVAGIESRDPETGENTFKVRPMWGGGGEHFIVEEKKLKSASVEKTAQDLLKGDRVNHYKHGPGYIDHIDDTTYSIPIYIIKLDSGDEIAVPKGEIEKTSKKKTSHTPGAIVQVVIPQGGINEKYNGKVGEVVAAVPDRSKISFKDMPSLWFEDNTIRVVASCKVCDSDMSLQSLKKLGKVECKCGAFYSWRQLERIAKTAAVNERAVRKVKKKATLELFKTDTDAIKKAEELEKFFEGRRKFMPVPISWDLADEASGPRIIVGDVRIDEAPVEGETYWVVGEGWEDVNAWGLKSQILASRKKKAKIVEKGDEYCVEAESGRSMGCYSTKAKAEKRLKQVEMFKHMKGSKKAQVERPEFVRDEHLEYLDELRESGVTNMFGAAPYLEAAYPDDFANVKEAQKVVVYWMETFSERHKESKTAQNVIFWFDDPKALKNLRYLQGPPTSPAGEEELLEKPGLEGEKLEVEKEVEKEASKKTAQGLTLQNIIDELNEDFAIFEDNRLSVFSGDYEKALNDWLNAKGYLIADFDHDHILKEIKRWPSSVEASKKTAQISFYENKIEAAWDNLEALEDLLDNIQDDYYAEESRVRRQRGDERHMHDLLGNIEQIKERIKELELSSEASKKTSRVKKSVRNFEVGDSVQIMDKEGNTNVVPEATIAKVDEYLGTDGQMHETVEVTGSANEDEQMWYGEEDYQVVLLDPIEASKKKKTKVSTEIKKEAKEKISGIVKEGLEKKAQEDWDKEDALEELKKLYPRKSENTLLSAFRKAVELDPTEDLGTQVDTACLILEGKANRYFSKKINRIEKTAFDIGENIELVREVEGIPIKTKGKITRLLTQEQREKYGVDYEIETPTGYCIGVKNEEIKYLTERTAGLEKKAQEEVEDIENWSSFRDEWLSKNRPGIIIVSEEDVRYQTGKKIGKLLLWTSITSPIYGLESFIVMSDGKWWHNPGSFHKTVNIEALVKKIERLIDEEDYEPDEAYQVVINEFEHPEVFTGPIEERPLRKQLLDILTAMGIEISSKVASIKKKAQGGGQFEMLRGGGGGSQDQLEPMGWQVQESKTPELPEQAEEIEEIGEEIVIRVDPTEKSVSVDFEGEKEEEVEKPIGAEAPPEKPVEKPREGERPEEEGLEEIPVNF